MLVFRVEHKVTGVGPYHSRFSNELGSNDAKLRLENILNNFFFKRYHVDPSDDMGDGQSFNLFGWKFGFKDEKSLAKWFDHPRGVKALQNLGFRVRVYEVPDSQVKVLKSQVCFYPDAGKRVAEHTLYSFCKQHSKYFA